MLKVQKLNNLRISMRDELARSALRFVPPDTVEDIVQETYVRLCQMKDPDGIIHPRAFLYLADPEFVTSYEIGLKNAWLQNKVQVNDAVFHLDYEDLQEKAFCPTCGVLGAGLNLFSNAAEVTKKGIQPDNFFTNKQS
jgi:hypothetical protein